MARRRPVDPPPAGRWPAHLHPCYVEDWTSPADDRVRRLAASADARTDPQEQLVMAMVVVARNRYRDARHKWAAENGVDWRLLPSMGRPRWRGVRRTL